MDTFIKFLLSLVRPFLTIIGFLTICDGVWNSEAVPEWFIGMVGGMVAWWFADRSLLHKKEREPLP